MKMIPPISARHLLAFCTLALCIVTNPEAAVSPSPRFTDIQLILRNADALRIKREMIQRAKAKVDMSYFIVANDATTTTVLRDLVDAGNRGVKIRLLVDYFLTYEQAPMLRALSENPNIEVKRFGLPSKEWLDALERAHIDSHKFIEGLVTLKPSKVRESLGKGDVLPPDLVADEDATPEAGANQMTLALRMYRKVISQVVGDEAFPILAKWQTYSSLNDVWDVIEKAGKPLSAKWQLSKEILIGLNEFIHRTHHKLLLVDDRCFEMGGRNLANEYQIDYPQEQHAFQDTDVYACDSRPSSSDGHPQAFERLWNDSKNSVPIAIDPWGSTATSPLASIAATAADASAPASPASSGGVIALGSMDGQMVNNYPGGVKGDPAITLAYARRILELASSGKPHQRIDIVSAYLLIGPLGLGSPTLLTLRQALLSAAKAGIDVNIYTNAMETTDLKPVNAASYHHLKNLLEAGIKVHELDPNQGSLHTKSAAIGDRWLMIGSYNMDPRSELYDTNNLIEFEDPDGSATAQFRKARIDGLHWTPLTLEALAKKKQESTKTFLEVFLFERAL